MLVSLKSGCQKMTGTGARPVFSKSAIGRMLLLTFASILPGCDGGGNGGSDLPFGSPPGNVTGSAGPDTLGMQEFELDEQTYVALAAGLYLGSTALDAVLNAQAVFMLLAASTAQEPTNVEPCDISGETVVEVVKPEYGSFTLVNTGDSVSFTNNACVDSTGRVRDGIDSLFVRLQAAEGTPGASQYELSSDTSTTLADGESSFARSHLEIVQSDLISSRGEVRFTGINNEVLQDTRAMNEDSLLSGIAAESLASFQSSTPGFYETVAGRFDTFAVETAILEVDGYNRIEKQFEFDVNSADGADSSYTLATTAPFVTMEVDRLPDPEDGDDDTGITLVALGGGFAINMDAGQRIEVSVIGSSSFDALIGPQDANVQISFDKEGDGSTDAQQTLSFEDFNASLFTLALHNP